MSVSQSSQNKSQKPTKEEEQPHGVLTAAMSKALGSLITSGLSKVDNSATHKTSPRMTSKFLVDDGYGTNLRPVKFKLDENQSQAKKFDSQICREFFQDLFTEQHYISQQRERKS